MSLFDMDMPELDIMPLDVQLVAVAESYGTREQRHAWLEQLSSDAKKQLKRLHGMRRWRTFASMQKEQKEAGLL